MNLLLFYSLSGWYEPANLDKLEAERLDLPYDAEERGAVRQKARQDAIRTTLLRHHFRKRSKEGCAEVPLDSDRVQMAADSTHVLFSIGAW